MGIVAQEASLGTDPKVGKNIAQIKNPYNIKRWLEAEGRGDEYEDKGSTEETLEYLIDKLSVKDIAEAGAYHLRRIATDIGYSLAQGKSSNKNIKEFFKNFNIDPSNRQEVENAIYDRLEGGVVDELTAMVIGGYNEGGAGVVKAQAEQGDWRIALAADSDPKTAGDYSGEISTLIDTYRQMSKPSYGFKEGPGYKPVPEDQRDPDNVIRDQTEPHQTVRVPQVTLQSVVENLKLTTDPEPKAKPLPSGAIDITNVAKQRDTKGNFKETRREQPSKNIADIAKKRDTLGNFTENLRIP